MPGGTKDGGEKMSKVRAYPPEGLEPNESVFRRASSVAKQDSGSFSYRASSFIMERMRGTSKISCQRL